tara:strand:- start:73 stop:870 length:798 start_codon:yes stop_codon:yes gene_type:complete
MTSNLWYPKEKPIQGITGWGGGATGLRMADGGPKYYSNDFDGTSELLLPWQNGNLNFSAAGNITIEWWLYLDTLNNDNKSYQTMVGRWDGSLGYCWLVDTSKNSGNINLYIGNGTGYTQSESTANGVIAAGQWYHIAIVKNGSGSSNSKIYVDGTSVHSFTWNTANTNSVTGVAVGNNYPDASNYGSGLDGKISNFRFNHGVVYSSNFTPPTEPFEGNSGGNTMLLMCKDDDPTTAEVNVSAVGGSSGNTITNNGGVTSSTDNPF